MEIRRPPGQSWGQNLAGKLSFFVNVYMGRLHAVTNPADLETACKGKQQAEYKIHYCQEVTQISKPNKCMFID